MADTHSSEKPRRGQSRPRKRTRKTSTAARAKSGDSTGCPEIHVGRAIRALREERNLSIRALAEESDLAVNTLSLIENGKTSPSVSTLQQLAGALGVPITAFFEVDIIENSVVHTRAGCSPHAAFTHGIVSDLGAGMAHRAIEPLIFTLEPGAVSGTQPVVHTGQEFVFCLAGCIAYTIDEQTYMLEPGDSLLFEARLPHHWKNMSTEQSKALLILCPFDDRDHPRDLHFMTRKLVFVTEEKHE